MTAPLTMNECSGPQAQACVADQEEPLYFCSTSDLLDWQADSDREVHTTLTRDLSDVDWNPRDPGDWVAMDTAWYVVGHDRDNGQGQTPPVGFSDLGDAEIFASKRRGPHHGL
jgi:Predicted lipoprotein involved in nitrous oxide reduction